MNEGIGTLEGPLGRAVLNALDLAVAEIENGGRSDERPQK